MAKNIIIISIIIGLIIVFSFFKKSSNTELNTTKITLKNKDYQIEIARSSSQKATGLSNRKNLCSNCGMIFIFNKDGALPFWMKDTLIPLDIIWINSQGRVTDIITATEIKSLKLLQNTQPAKYVLELNANEAQKIDLKVGDIIQLPNLND
ncbi:MAG: DUF192 domain-containing protein [Candidatus Shapirobacteria bacterium]|jgi:hypothetical protein